MCRVDCESSSKLNDVEKPSEHSVKRPCGLLDDMSKAHLFKYVEKCSLQDEWIIFYYASYRDWPFILIAWVISFGALKTRVSSDYSLHSLTLVAFEELMVLVFLSLGVYAFDLSNQSSTESILEDSKSKPNRPIPSGLLSQESAFFRMKALFVMFPVLGFLIGGISPCFHAIMFVIFTLIHNSGSADKFWASKSLLCSCGLFCNLSASWTAIAPMTESTMKWILVTAATFFLVINVQDLRDQEGDRLVHRKTLPIVFGDLPSRIAISGALLLQCCSLAYLTLSDTKPLDSTYAMLWCVVPLIVLIIWQLFIAVRLMVYRSAEHDQKTYDMTQLMYVGMMLTVSLNVA